jgi:hypothetical protein
MIALYVSINPALREMVEMTGELWTRLYQQAVTEAALMWHGKYLPQHFTPQAFGRYPNAYRRDSKTVGRGSSKKTYMTVTAGPEGLALKTVRQKGIVSEFPMVKTGELRDILLSGAPTVKTGGRGQAALRAVIKLPFARKANFWGAGNQRHDFHKAISAVNSQEMAEINKLIEERMAALFNEELARRARETTIDRTEVE